MARDDRSAELVRDDLDVLLAELDRATDQSTLFAPQHHWLLPSDVNPQHLRRIVRTAHEQHPEDFQTLLGTAGVGPATVRSLSLLAEVIHDAPASHRDPTVPLEEDAQPDDRMWADYAYAHGGKDGTPFPVDRQTYDRNIEILTNAVRQARLGDGEKSDALRRLGE